MGRAQLPPLINRYSGVLDVQASCDDCPWEAYSRNALGIASQHARRTGHQVRVEQTLGITYNRKAT